MKSYSEQRKERLSEVVFDYLSDEDTTPDELLMDLLEEVKSSFEYYDKYATKCKKVLDKLPNNNIEVANDKDWNDFWENLDKGTSKWR
jgi:hypothetical protein